MSRFDDKMHDLTVYVLCDSLESDIEGYIDWSERFMQASKSVRSELICDQVLDWLHAIYGAPTGTYEEIAEAAVMAYDFAWLAEDVEEAISSGIEAIGGVEYLIDGASGHYIANEFALRYGGQLVDDGSIDQEEYDILLDPDHEHYSDAWGDVLYAGPYDLFGDGYEYTLFGGDGLWAVREDLAGLMPDGWPS